MTVLDIGLQNDDEIDAVEVENVERIVEEMVEEEAPWVEMPKEEAPKMVMPKEEAPREEIPMPTEDVKVSTGCGTSPDREIEEIFANQLQPSAMKSFTPLREIPSRSSKVSIGTSPPPQSTSTQVSVLRFG